MGKIYRNFGIKKWLGINLVNFLLLEKSLPLKKKKRKKNKMGRKTDVKAIFQIGKNNNYYVWDSKYFEKKKESNIFIFQSVEIKKFIKKKLQDSGLVLNTCKIKYLESTLKIFVSYLKLSNSSNIRLERNQKVRLVKNRQRKEGIKNSILKIKKQMKIYRKIKKYFELKKIYLDLTLSQKRELKKEVTKAKIKRLLDIFKIVKSHSKNKKILFEKIIPHVSKIYPSFGMSLDVEKTISKVTKLRFSICARIEKVRKIEKLKKRLNYIKFIKSIQSMESITRVKRVAKLALKSSNINKLQKERLQKFISQLRHKYYKAKRSSTKLKLRSSNANKLQRKKVLKFVNELSKDRIHLKKKFEKKIDLVKNLKWYDLLMKLFVKCLLSRICYRKSLLIKKRPNKNRNIYHSWSCINFFKNFFYIYFKN